MIDMPASRESEEGLLGCCMVDEGRTMTRTVTAGITAEAFHFPECRTVFEAMLSAWRNNYPINQEVVVHELITLQKFLAVGGGPFFEQLSKAATTLYAGRYIEVLLQLQVRRNLLRAALEISERAHDQGVDFAELRLKSVNVVAEAITPGARHEKTNSEVADSVIASIEAENEKSARAVDWPVEAINAELGYLQPGSLVVVGGRPSTGKSALADQTAHCAAKAGHEVVVFTYEMSAEEKVQRFTQAETGFNFATRFAFPERRKQLRESAKRFAAMKNIHICEQARTLDAIQAKLKMIKAARGDIGLIVIDFLQMLSRIEGQKDGERTDEHIGRLSASFKQAARDYNCPVLLLSSLNRGNVHDGRPPSMTDLRNSGEIESDADVIILLHWPGEAPNGMQNDINGQFPFVQLLQEKGRMTGTASTIVSFNRSATRFENAQK